MGTIPDFVQRFFSEAISLIEKRQVNEPMFSRGTYHIEVQKEFAFFQMKDDGTITDAFCSCAESEKGKGCLHLATAYLQIFNQTDEPLHVRFRKSFWNRLFQMEAKRNGFDTNCLVHQVNGSYVCFSQTKLELFSIQLKTAEAERKFLECTFERPVETEETSIKFSQLSEQEIELYRSGQAGHLLRYELSFWSDLAKWFMYLQELQYPYQIQFIGDAVPHEILVSFDDVVLKVYISKVNLPWIIPSLQTVQIPLQVVDQEAESIDSIVYDEAQKALLITHKNLENQDPNQKKGEKIGDWMYVKGDGFYRQSMSPLLEVNRIPAEKIGDALTEHTKELSRFLVLHTDLVQPKYSLFFDRKKALHIRTYLFEKSDLADAQVFFPWIYVPQKGFYQIGDWTFPEIEKVIPREEIAVFVTEHRLWLNQFPQFQTHVGSLESYLTYQVNQEGDLFFDVTLSMVGEDTIDCGEWIYLKGSGFYMKRANTRLPLHPGLHVLKEEVSSFISAHIDELEQVQGFFSEESPLVEMGLSVDLNEEGLIRLIPKIEYASHIQPQDVSLYKDFVYTKGKGFSAIPSAFKIPERYQKKCVLPRSEEASFLNYELEPLKPFLLELDPRLKRPMQLKLRVRKAIPDPRNRTKSWLVDLGYESEHGITDIFPIWDALVEKRRHLFSEAGLLSVRDPRFHWIKQLSKRRLHRKKRMIRLNTLEWIRLSAFEEIATPRGEDQKSVQTRRMIQELSSFETKQLFDLTGLKSTLRPYQEEGVRWLWFLYLHGLSGLLCDDMGLGKTHQTMALLCSISNIDPDRQFKYLIVCPTSVIYHWQDLLKRFLPDLRICVYYGLHRSLGRFEDESDVLLTSYGILRQSKETLRGYSFEAAFFDEIQVAKNYASQTHMALKRIRANMKLGLTGTPIENRLREMKALFDVILPSYMPSDAVFRDLFVHPIEKEGSVEKIELLNRMVRPFILRRKKSEVLKDLPEKMEEIAYCDLSEDQKGLYNEIAMRTKERLVPELQDPSKSVPYIHIFAALTKLKQICDHPILIEGDAKDFQRCASGKWDLFVELLSEARASKQKVVVFSQYTKMLQVIEHYLKKKKIGYASIKGITKNRSEELRKFREDPECEIFVASLLAAGVGIDLTTASIVIHYDRWWNPAKENQATDRVHRLGQNRGVQVFKLVTKGTIEERIHSIIERKTGLFEEILGTEDQINYLTREELLEVFEKISPSS